MKKWLNDPSINRKYNFVYKITNLINDKTYIGVHRTDNLNDGYLGSGKLIQRSINKYGKENFKKDILNFFDTYLEALNYEKELVNINFINLDNNYNLKTGGYGSSFISEETKRIISQIQKENWKNPEYREKMLKHFRLPERCKKISDKIKDYIKNNNEEFKDRMDKINHDPEKIKKTAEKHTGMKRSEETKKRQSISKKIFIEKNGTEAFGKGLTYIHNIETKERKRANKNDPIPNGWAKGMGPQSKPKIERGSTIYIYNKELMLEKRHLKNIEIPEGWNKGRLRHNG